MCIGLPMRVIRTGVGSALCEGMGIRRWVDTLLVGDQPPGAWLLVFLESAREVLSETRAREIADAVRAVDLAMRDPRHANTAPFDALFPDLAGKEPQKPPSLLALEAQRRRRND